ncbi:MAG: LytTR family transcriptional regulator [Lachnospiraceae bacterium]
MWRTDIRSSTKLIPICFFQIHRSYIVNLKYIEKVHSHEITLCNRLKVIIGRAHSKEFKKKFFEWRMWFDN